MSATTLSLLLALAQPCLLAQPIESGAPSPCNGVLWPVGKTRMALNCLKADLPQCKSDLILARATAGADLAACMEGLAAWKGAAQAVCPPTPKPREPETPWGTVVGTGAAALVVGFLAGALVVSLD